MSPLVARLAAPVRYPHVRFDFISDILLVVLAWITAGHFEHHVAILRERYL